MGGFVAIIASSGTVIYRWIILLLKYLYQSVHRPAAARGGFEQSPVALTERQSKNEQSIDDVEQNLPETSPGLGQNSLFLPDGLRAYLKESFRIVGMMDSRLENH